MRGEEHEDERGQGDQNLTSLLVLVWTLFGYNYLCGHNLMTVVSQKELEMQANRVVLLLFPCFVPNPCHAAGVDASASASAYASAWSGASVATSVSASARARASVGAAVDALLLLRPLQPCRGAGAGKLKCDGA